MMVLSESFERNQTVEDIGGVQFLLKYLIVYLPYSIGTVVATIVGIAGKKKVTLN